MTRRRIAVAALLLAACGRPAATPPVASAAPPAANAAPPAASAAERAAAMDTRIALPLLPMMAEHQKEQMRGHLSAVREIIAALAKKDYAAVAAAADKIGYTDSMAQMCTHMGAGASGFTPTAIAFHRTADTITVAAKRQDPAAVLAALDATLDKCVACHATYKQQLVDEATWTKLTSTPPPMAH